MRYLLHDRFDDYFTEEVPIFYKNKIAKINSSSVDTIVPTKYYYQSAIDLALKNNQVRAI